MVFSSAVGGKWGKYFETYPEYLGFYQDTETLGMICAKMRNEILKSVPVNEKESWENSHWYVAVQRSNGTEPLAYDHAQHIHRDQIVASLTIEGSGTIAKIPTVDISGMTPEQICEEGADMPGYTYQARPGDLMIINGVHYPGGGLHAAPQSNGAIPARLTILVSIEKDEANY